MFYNDFHPALRLHLIGPVIHQALKINRIVGDQVRRCHRTGYVVVANFLSY